MIHDAWYNTNDTWCMIHDELLQHAHMIHDEFYVMNATIHAMNYVECYHGYQHHYHCLLTHNNPMFWLLLPLAHTQPHTSSPNNVAVPVSVVWCLLIWSGRRPWRYGRKRWQENEALVGYARMHVDVCSMVINAALPGNAYWLVNTVHTGSNHADTTRVVITIQWSVLDTSNNHTVKRNGH